MFNGLFVFVSMVKLVSFDKLLKLKKAKRDNIDMLIDRINVTHCSFHSPFENHEDPETYRVGGIVTKHLHSDQPTALRGLWLCRSVGCR